MAFSLEATTGPETPPSAPSDSALAECVCPNAIGTQEAVKQNVSGPIEMDVGLPLGAG